MILFDCDKAELINMVYDLESTCKTYKSRMDELKEENKLLKLELEKQDNRERKPF
jgi:hypothetical protein